MDDTQRRLVTCFATVFPTLSPSEILGASSDSVAGWDSLAMVTLLAVIEEEFGMQFPPAEVEALLSFRAFWDYMRPRIGSQETSNTAQCSAANV